MGSALNEELYPRITMACIILCYHHLSEAVIAESYHHLSEAVIAEMQSQVWFCFYRRNSAGKCVMPDGVVHTFVLLVS